MNSSNSPVGFDSLIPLMREAGKIMLSAKNVESGDNVHDKPGTANFVTYFDVKVQNFLMEKIVELFPDAVFIAEEKDNDPKMAMSKICFIIDPIDGTTNFIHGYNTSSISIGVISGGKPIFGAIYDPYRDELFSAEVGCGAFLNGRPIHVANRPLDHALVGVGVSPYHKETLAEKTFGVAHELFLTCADIRRSGSAAIDLASVACGRFDIFFELVLAPWDYAAASIIITEAGGCITDAEGHELQFGEPSAIVATTPRVQKDVLAIIKKYI